MTYAPRNLGVVSYCNGTTIWHYRSTEDAPVSGALVQEPGFFGSGTLAGLRSEGAPWNRNMGISPGDIIMVSASDGGAMLFVDSCDPEVVTRPMCATLGAAAAPASAPAEA